MPAMVTVFVLSWISVLLMLLYSAKVTDLVMYRRTHMMISVEFLLIVRGSLTDVRAGRERMTVNRPH